MSEDRQLPGVIAALLAEGGRIDRLSRALTSAALIALLLLPASFGLPTGLPTAILAAVALVGLVEVYLAIRVGFDAALFAGLRDSADFAGLDRALLALGLVPPAKTGRPAADRARGARRLLYYQGSCLVAQAALILVGAAVAATGSGK